MKFSLLIVLMSTLVLAEVNQEHRKNELNKWEFRTAPVALLASWYTLDISYRISEKLSTGPAIVIYGAAEQGNMFLPSYKGKAVGWQVSYFLDSVRKNSWYLGSHLYFENYNSYPHALNGYYEINGSRLSTVIGYKIKNGGILTMLGVGIEYRDHNVSKHEESAAKLETHEANIFPMLELKIGIEI